MSIWFRRQMAALVLLAVGFAAPADAVEIIVAPDVVSVTTLSRNGARALFSMRQTRWPDGRAVRVFTLDETEPAHEALCREALDLYSYQLREAQDRGIYTGATQAPIRVASEAEMKRRVAATPGAIGYVTSTTKDDHARTIPIR